jgi:hypothetical protein
MLDSPALLNTAMAPGDSVIALNNGRDIGVDDVLEIDGERFQVAQVISLNNYGTTVPAAKAHAVNAVVYNLPNPTNQKQLNSVWIGPAPGGWAPSGGVWVEVQAPAGP